MGKARLQRTGINVEYNNVLLGSFSTLDFTGAGVTVVNSGSGTATITIGGGGGGSAWLLDGNSNANERYIGTNNNFDFPVRTNNNEIARFTVGGSLGIGTYPSAARLHTDVTFSGSAIATNIDNEISQITIDSSADTSNSFTATKNQLRIQGNSNYTGFETVSSYNVTFYDGTASMFVIGGSGGLVENRNTGLLNFSFGTAGKISNSSSGTIGFGAAIFGQINNIGTGTMNDAINIFAVELQNNNGTINNLYGVRINDQSGNVGVAVDYNFYSFGNNSKNIFEGRIGVGLNNPAAKIDIVGETNSALSYSINVVNSTLTQTYWLRDDGQIWAGTVANGNMFIGANTGNPNGTGNTALGVFTLTNLSTGINNVAIGYEAMYSTTTGNTNIAIGFRALNTATDANQCIAIGFGALQFVTGTVNYLTAVGYAALQSYITNGNDTAIGGRAMSDVTTGYDNVSVGYQTLEKGTTTTQNVAIGTNSLRGNTNGGAVPWIGQRNTSLGTYTGQYVAQNASDNVYVGYDSGRYNNDLGTPLGLAGRSGNTFVGTTAGTRSTSNNSVFIGYGAGYSETNDNKFIVANIANELIKGDFSTQEVEFLNTIQTAQPSASGAGKWKLGKHLAGAVVVDLANFVEVEIDGTRYKLIKAI